MFQSIAGMAGRSTAGASNVGALNVAENLDLDAKLFASLFAVFVLVAWSGFAALPASRSAPRPTTASTAADCDVAESPASPGDRRGLALAFPAPPKGGFAGGAFTRVCALVRLMIFVRVFGAGATAVLKVMMLDRTSAFFLVCVDAAADAAVPSNTALVAAAATAAPSASSTAGPAPASPPSTTVAPSAAAACIAGAGPEPESRDAPEPPREEEEEEAVYPLYEGTYAVPAVVLRLNGLLVFFTMLDFLAVAALLDLLEPGLGPFLFVPLSPSAAARPTANAVLTRLAVSSAAVAALPKRFRPVAGALRTSMLAGRTPLASSVSR